eukprot:3239178-Amphidinium_carterae.1
MTHDSDVRRCGQKWSLILSDEVRSFSQSQMLISRFMASRSAQSCQLPNHWQFNNGRESVLCNSQATTSQVMDHESTLRAWSQYDQDRQALRHSFSSHGWLHQPKCRSAEVRRSSDLLSHEEEADMQHAEDVAKSFNLFDPGNQPGHSAERTHHLTSEAAQPLTVPEPQEPSAVERESYTTSPIQEL